MRRGRRGSACSVGALAVLAAGPEPAAVADIDVRSHSMLRGSAQVWPFSMSHTPLGAWCVVHGGIHFSFSM